MPKACRLALALLGLVALLGCSDTDEAGADAGSRDAGAAPADAGSTLAEPALPMFLPCAPGWREVEVAGVTACDPWPETGRGACAIGEAHFPGEPGCRGVGSACPVGEWPDDLPPDAQVRFVRAGATGGTGSREAPLGTLAEALAAASIGDVVALGRGTFEGGVQISRGVTVRGTCSAETEIRVSAAGPMSALSIVAPNVVVRDVRISGLARGVSVESADPVTLEGVVVERTTGVGIGIGAGTRLTGRDVVVRETAPDADGRFGIGLLVRHGAAIDIERVVLARNGAAAMSVDDAGTTARLADVAILETAEDVAVGLGRGVTLQNGGEVTLERAVVEGHPELGLFAVAMGSSFGLRDVVVRDTRGRGDGWFGRGIALARDATATLERVRIERSHETGLHLLVGTRVAATDLLIVATQPQPFDRRFGMGAAVLDATLEGARVVIADNHAVGLSAEGSSATVALSDLVVRGTRPSEAPLAGWFGRGINLQVGAVARIERANIEGNRDVGIFVAEGAQADLLDVVVSDTAERACAETTCAGNGAGTGLGVYGGAVDLQRFVVTRSALCGVQIARDGSVDLHEGEVTRNAFGVNVQVPGYDVARLMDRVIYRDNDVTLDATELPVPESVGSE